MENTITALYASAGVCGSVALLMYLNGDNDVAAAALLSLALAFGVSGAVTQDIYGEKPVCVKG